MVPVLVNSPHVRVLSEEGQPLPSQLSAVWNSATDAVPNVYQVWGAPHPQPICASLPSCTLPGHSGSPALSLPHNTDPTAAKPPGPMCVPPQRQPCSAEQGLCPADPQSFPEMGAGSGPHAACRCLSWPACLRWGCVCCSCTRPWMATPRQSPPRACTCTAGTCPCASPRLCPCTSSQLLLMTSAWRTSTCRPASWGARACCR